MELASTKFARLTRLRRAANLAAVRNRLITGIHPSPPTVTTPAAFNDFNVALPRTYTIGTRPDLVRFFGGALKLVTSVSNWGLPCMTRPTTANCDGTDHQVSTGYEFYTDSTDICIRHFVQSETKYRIAVDDMYIGSSAATFLAGTTSYVRLAFASRAERKIRVENQGNTLLGSIYVPNAYDIWKGDETPPKAVFFTDSYGHDAYPGFMHLCFPQLTSTLLGWDGSSSSAGGTGYWTAHVSNGANGMDRIGDVSRQAYDVVVIALGTNDTNSTGSSVTLPYRTPAEYTAGALYCMQRARALLPNALIVQMGVWPRVTGPSQGLIDRENAVFDAVTTFNDPFTMPMRVSTDARPWLYGTGTSASPSGAGNNDDLLGADFTHPTALGQMRIARRFNSSFRAWLGN